MYAVRYCQTTYLVMNTEHEKPIGALRETFSTYKRSLLVGSSLIALASFSYLAGSCLQPHRQTFALPSTYNHPPLYESLSMQNGTNDYLSFFFRTAKGKFQIDKIYHIQGEAGNVDKYTQDYNAEGKLLKIVIYAGENPLATNTFAIDQNWHELIVEDFSGKKSTLRTQVLPKIPKMTRGDGRANVIVNLPEGVMPTRAEVTYKKGFRCIL